MGYMKALDIVLTEHKLSDAQKNAVVELLSGGFTAAKTNTINSLEKRGLILNVQGSWMLEPEFHAELKAAYSQPEPREETTVDEIVAELDKGNPWNAESVEPQEDAVVLPFLNRKARRDLSRHAKRINRKRMRDHGKRVRKYGTAA